MAKRKRKSAKRGTAAKRWTQRVTETSDALTLEEGVFKKPTPRAVALSLKRSAEASHRRKSSPYRSAMSMLVFYINRAGKGLSKADRDKLEKAKDELRALYGKDTGRNGRKKTGKKGKMAKKKSKKKKSKKKPARKRKSG